MKSNEMHINKCHSHTILSSLCVQLQKEWTIQLAYHAGGIAQLHIELFSGSISLCHFFEVRKTAIVRQKGGSATCPLCPASTWIQTVWVCKLRKVL